MVLMDAIHVDLVMVYPSDEVDGMKWLMALMIDDGFAKLGYLDDI